MFFKKFRNKNFNSPQTFSGWLRHGNYDSKLYYGSFLIITRLMISNNIISESIYSRNTARKYFEYTENCIKIQ